MPRDYAESLLHTGILEAKAGQKTTARRYLERAINTSGEHAVLSEAWYWLSTITDDPAEKRSALENCLSFDMRHARARRELAILDGKLDAQEIINPDALPVVSTDPAQAAADRFMCPQCGAKMSFAPDGVSLFCEHCTRRQVLSSQGEAREQDFLVAMATARGHGVPVAMQVFHCQGCGAEFILPPEVISASCAYCDSPHVVSLESSRELLQPEGIIPQAFDRRTGYPFAGRLGCEKGDETARDISISRAVFTCRSGPSTLAVRLHTGVTGMNPRRASVEARQKLFMWMTNIRFTSTICLFPPVVKLPANW